MASISTSRAGVFIWDLNKVTAFYWSSYPRPIKGIFVAITVMNCTFASNGRLAM